MLLKNQCRSASLALDTTCCWKRTTLLAVALGLGMIGLPWGEVAAAQDVRPPSAKQDGGPPPAQQDAEKERLIQEIKDLRKRMGGGVTESLKGLDLDNPLANPRRKEAAGDPFDSESEFRAAVRQLVDESAPPEYSRRIDPSQAPRPMGGGAGGQAEGVGLPFGPLQVPPPRPAGSLRGSGVIAGVNNQLPQGPREPWQALLASAQLLDQAANELESAGVFDIADEIRAQSSRVRAKARQMYEGGQPAAGGQRPSPPPPAESAPPAGAGAGAGTGQPGGQE